MGPRKIPTVARNWLQGLLAPLLRESDGATAIEYAIIAGGIALAIVGSIAAASGSLQAIYNKLPTLF